MFDSLGSARNNKSFGLTNLTGGTEPPTYQSTTQSGNSIKYESNNFTIDVKKENQQVLITDKNTGETFHAWGDPHTVVNGRPTGDFKNDLTINLSDGTKVTLQTTGMGDKNAETFIQNVVVTNGEYGAAISGVLNGDLKFRETHDGGYELDGMAADNNNIYQSGNGLSGFHGIVNNQLETIDTSKEYSSMEVDDNQAANHATHAAVTSFINNGNPSKPGTNNTSSPSHELNSLNNLIQNIPKPVPPNVAAAAKEAERQGQELADAAKGDDSKKTQQANDEFQAALNQMTLAAMESASGSESSKGGKGSWYLSLAKAMGRAANKGADRIQNLTDKLSSASKDDKPNVQIELQAASQQFSYVMSAINNALSSIGAAATAMVRRS